jgi:hypothetical protein
MKALAAISIALAVLALPTAAPAQTRVHTAHAETASALGCLLEHRQRDCRHGFVGSATRPASFWLRQNPNRDFDLGSLVSSEYAGTQAVNAYLTKFLGGRKADVYDVKFRHQEKTFYIVPPGPDGNIRYMQVRGGGPNDEREDLFVHGPG